MIMPLTPDVLVTVFKTYRGHLEIWEDGDPRAVSEKIADVMVSGSHEFVASVLAMASDAFKEDQLR